MADLKKIRSLATPHTNSVYNGTYSCKCDGCKQARIPKIMKHNTYQPIDRQFASEEGWEDEI